MGGAERVVAVTDGRSPVAFANRSRFDGIWGRANEGS